MSIIKLNKEKSMDTIKEMIINETVKIIRNIIIINYNYRKIINK